MTPAILVNLLGHAILPGGISSLDVLVLDEAHHCKKKHPYNLVMGFYMEAGRQGAPLSRVLGMTAAPAVAKTGKGALGFMQSLRELEANMGARVVTVADRSALEAVVPQPDLAVVRYPWTDLAAAGGGVAVIRQTLERELLRLDAALGLEE